MESTAGQIGCARGGGDATFFVRSGYLGSQAFAPITWGGDQGCDWTEDRGLPELKVHLHFERGR